MTALITAKFKNIAFYLQYVLFTSWYEIISNILPTAQLNVQRTRDYFLSVPYQKIKTPGKSTRKKFLPACGIFAWLYLTLRTVVILHRRQYEANQKTHQRACILFTAFKILYFVTATGTLTDLNNSLINFHT